MWLYMASSIVISNIVRYNNAGICSIISFKPCQVSCCKNDQLAIHHLSPELWHKMH